MKKIYETYVRVTGTWLDDTEFIKVGYYTSEEVAKAEANGVVGIINTCRPDLYQVDVYLFPIELNTQSPKLKADLQDWGITF